MRRFNARGGIGREILTTDFTDNTDFVWVGVRADQVVGRVRKQRFIPFRLPEAWLGTAPRGERVHSSEHRTSPGPQLQKFCVICEICG
jgi:hypothetical protein